MWTKLQRGNIAYQLFIVSIGQVATYIYLLIGGIAPLEHTVVAHRELQWLGTVLNDDIGQVITRSESPFANRCRLGGNADSSQTSARERLIRNGIECSRQDDLLKLGAVQENTFTNSLHVGTHRDLQFLDAVVGTYTTEGIITDGGHTITNDEITHLRSSVKHIGSDGCYHVAKGNTLNLRTLWI